MDTSALQSLVPATASNYCVLVLTNGDTVLWENTSVYGCTPFVDTVTINNTLYLRAESVYGSPTFNDKYMLFEIEFRAPIANAASMSQCGLLDNMIHTGNVPVSKTDAVLAFVNHTGYGTSTEYTEKLKSTNGPSTVEVLSITKIAETNGCTTFRTKAKIANIMFGPLGCQVPAYTIKEGLIQMDFKIK